VRVILFDTRELRPADDWRRIPFDYFVFDDCVFGRGHSGQARYNTMAPQHEASFESGVPYRWNYDASSVFDATT